MSRPRVDPQIRFVAKFIRGSSEVCWLWLGKPAADGYGQFDNGHKTVGAHQFAYSLYVGDIVTGLHVLRTCDNRLCVNPNHLWLGTALDNMRDMIAKGRKVVCIGVQNGMYGKRSPGFTGRKHKPESLAQANAARAKRRLQNAH